MRNPVSGNCIRKSQNRRGSVCSEPLQFCDLESQNSKVMATKWKFAMTNLIFLVTNLDFSLTILRFCNY